MATAGMSSEIPPKPNDVCDEGVSAPHCVQFTLEATEPALPPTYDEAINPSGLPPPSYESLFGRVKQVHKQSSGTFDFLKNVIILLAGTIGCTVIIGFTIIIPVSMIVIGAVYFNDCPISYLIPLYLIVGGFLSIAKQVCHIVKRCSRCVRRTTEEQEEKSSTFQNGVACFMLAWFILGSFWVYKEFQPSYDPASGALYCHKTVYLFAFWQITSVYIMLSLASVCLCTVSLAVIAFARNHVQITTSSPS